MSERMTEAMRLAAENCSTPTHPDGCLAVTGWDDTPDGIRWIVLVNICPHGHPSTGAELVQQYADEGWTNIDEGRP